MYNILIEGVKDRRAAIKVYTNQILNEASDDEERQMYYETIICDMSLAQQYENEAAALLKYGEWKMWGHVEKNKIGKTDKALLDKLKSLFPALYVHPDQLAFVGG